MELSELGCWKLSDAAELFFNEASSTFFVKNDQSIYFLNDTTWIKKFDLGDHGKRRFKKACISNDQVLLCYQVSDNEMVRHI
jgi:hypothetical protein